MWLANSTQWQICIWFESGKGFYIRIDLHGSVERATKPLKKIGRGYVVYRPVGQYPGNPSRFWYYSVACGLPRIWLLSLRVRRAWAILSISAFTRSSNRSSSCEIYETRTWLASPLMDHCNTAPHPHYHTTPSTIDVTAFWSFNLSLSFFFPSSFSRFLKRKRRWLVSKWIEMTNRKKIMWKNNKSKDDILCKLCSRRNVRVSINKWN